MAKHQAKKGVGYQISCWKLWPLSSTAALYGKGQRIVLIFPLSRQWDSPKQYFPWTEHDQHFCVSQAAHSRLVSRSVLQDPPPIIQERVPWGRWEITLDLSQKAEKWLEGEKLRIRKEFLSGCQASALRAFGNWSIGFMKVLHAYIINIIHQ